ncbi:Uma2 family endonuclease [Synechococcus sp. PCC 7336]|uniref:Uma2 family endonuclease n=1 Tax=Synechococcus sp. PCC 7336 TaxID=195250 RepID=UPI00056EE8CC|nr:Uma2 family endonuclease [Synechococcus sp. PCC 7336]
MTGMLVKVPPSCTVTPEQFEHLAAANPELRLELTAAGRLIVMSPTGSEGGRQNARLTIAIGNWALTSRAGEIFDSSTGFTLPNGAIRSPDVAWIEQSRWDALPPQQRKGFAPICPDFVLELASETDDIEELRDKMQEYIDNGCRLGWSIDPRTGWVEIYRGDRPVERLKSPQVLSGEAVLVGLEIQLDKLFPEGFEPQP